MQKSLIAINFGSYHKGSLIKALENLHSFGDSFPHCQFSSIKLPYAVVLNVEKSLNILYSGSSLLAK